VARAVAPEERLIGVWRIAEVETDVAGQQTAVFEILKKKPTARPFRSDRFGAPS